LQPLNNPFGPKVLPSLRYILLPMSPGRTHPELFSPPELNRLPFRTMMEREWCLSAAAYRLIDCDQRAGLVEAVMNLTGSDATSSEAWLRTWVESNASIVSMYRQLQVLAVPRRLVDKSTLNASSEEVLARSRCVCQ
jgi:hypothetical protein